MPFYTENEIKRVRSIDLLTYLQTYEPTELVRLRGNNYSTVTHDSLKISPSGKWYWWSRGFGGSSALDYLVKVKGLQFTDAMKILTDNSKDFQSMTPKPFSHETKTEKRLLLPEKSDTNREIIKYLTGRGIDGDLIDACIHRGVLFESLPYHNCVFVGFDEQGTARYACFRSTNELKMVGEAAGSDKRYSFRTNAFGRWLHVFESPIDLLSHMTTVKLQTGRWIAEPMLSLGGVYAPGVSNTVTKVPVALDNMLKNHPEVDTIALHLDNDKAGRGASRSITEQLSDKYKIRDEPPAVGKDCNDYLMHVRGQTVSFRNGPARYDNAR